MKNIIKAPLVTEKANLLSEDSGVYTFIVDKDANKVQIKNAIESTFGVTVDSVRTINVAGKLKTRYTKSRILSGRKPNYKKAYVKLGPDEFIDIYEDQE